MHPLRTILARRAADRQAGVVSYCTANELVIEATAEDAAARGRPLVVEATANQVNQFGGYTGMYPADYAKAILGIAAKAGLPPGDLILGGDHLGPLLWQHEPETAAMDKAETLVRGYVSAGFSKIHLDTSMRVGDDDPSLPLPVATVAKRGARLARAALEERDRLGPDAPELAFIIGSEVPVPGGTRRNEESIAVTRVEDFEETVACYRDVFAREGLARAWERVVAVVAQPGVEFSDAHVFQYRPAAAAPLMRALERHSGLVFEGHSTDYQTPESLRAMVEGGVGIMKVGPELTFALREGMFALDALESELLPPQRRSHFRAVLETVMLEHPGFWEKYYHGSHAEQMLALRYSFSDRCRYYLSNPDVRAALERLCANYDRLRPTLNIVHQFLPAVAASMMDGEYLSAAGVLKRHLALGVLAKFQSAIS